MSTAVLAPSERSLRRERGKSPRRAFLRSVWIALCVIVGWVPITARGAILLAGLGSAAWFIGVDRRDLVLISAGCIVAGWMSISVVLVLLASLWLQVRPQRVPPDPLDID